MLIEQIVMSLKNDIAEGKIGPDKKLPSPEELQAQFGVGKSTIREAIKILEGMGLVKIRKGRAGGTFTTGTADRITADDFARSIRLDESNLLAFISHRKLAEPNLIHRACQKRTAGQLDRMREALELLDSTPRNRERYISATREFFSVIAESSGNAFSYAFYKQLIPLLDNASGLLHGINKCFDISIHFYAQILEAIETQDPDKGAMLGDAYLVQLETYVRDHVKRTAKIKQVNNVIKWGVIADLTGPTSEHGNQSIMGMMAAARVINDTGGVCGNKLELIVLDSKYSLAQTAKAYKQIINTQGVLGLYMQSTGATISLCSMATQDRMLMFTAAISDKLSNPAQYPYHFSLGPTYGDMAKICLNYIRGSWTDRSRKPRMVFMFPDNSYGRDPLDVGKLHAAKVGVEIGPDQIVNWPTLDATPQLTSMVDFDPDFVFLTSTAMHAAAVLRDSKRLNTRAQFFLNIRAFNEQLPQFAMGAAEGAFGIQAAVPYGADVPGMKRIVQDHDKWHPFHNPSIAYIEGWANILVPMEGCRIAAESGNLTVDGIKDALETLTGFDSGGLMPPITYTPTDHRGCTHARVCRINRENLVPVTDYLNPTVRAREKGD